MISYLINSFITQNRSSIVEKFFTNQHSLQVEKEWQGKKNNGKICGAFSESEQEFIWILNLALTYSI